MAEVTLERIVALQKEIDEINRLNIRDVAILKNGKPLDISTRIRDDLRFTGLSTFAILKDLGCKLDRQDQMQQQMHALPADGQRAKQEKETCSTPITDPTC